MKIELYNEKWLRTPNLSTPTHSTITNQPSSELDGLAFILHPDTPFSTTSDLHSETNTNSIVCKHKDDLSSLHQPSHPAGNTISTPTPVVTSPVCLFDALLHSTDCLLFIQYTSEGTMLRRYYLVQVDLEAS